MAGLFITLEGVEGVGKSTNLAFIAEWLQAQNVDFIQTREPGGTPLAEQLRDLLLAKRDENVDPTAELLMVFAARAQHINQLILPALSAQRLVLSDRFTDATYAYQGAGRGLSLALIEKLEQMVVGSRQPDLTFYLDIDVRIGLERARQRGELDRFEKEDVAFFERVRQGYLARIAVNPQRFVLIDAAQPLKDVQRAIAEHLQARLVNLLSPQNVGGQ